jgi:predicted nucleic acid-binding protein
VKLFFDTSVLVDLDRQREPTIRALEEATRKDTGLWISAVTVSEILVGALLRKDHEKATLRAREVLGRLVWQDLDGDAAERTARLLAHPVVAGARVEYQDAAIAGCALAAHADLLVTENLEHFRRFPPLEGKVVNAVGLVQKLKKA